eukprot:6194355-Pleurochrysis_carterae.AAC.1
MEIRQGHRLYIDSPGQWCCVSVPADVCIPAVDRPYFLKHVAVKTTGTLNQTLNSPANSVAFKPSASPPFPWLHPQMASAPRGEPQINLRGHNACIPYDPPAAPTAHTVSTVFQGERGASQPRYSKVMRGRRCTYFAGMKNAI